MLSSTSLRSNDVDFLEVCLDTVKAAEHLREVGAGLVMEMAGELASLLILQPKQARRELADGGLGGAPFRQIARDLGESGEVSRVVPHGGDHDVRPKPRAALAHAPALVLDPSVLDRLPQQLGGTSPLAILRRVERRHRFADDLVARISLDQSGAFIPRHDVAVGIQHEDRVVLNTRDEQANQLVVRHSSYQKNAPRRTV
jgi:hypothetical protein